MKILFIGSIISMMLLPLKPEADKIYSVTGSEPRLLSASAPDTSRNNMVINLDTFYLELLPPSSGVQFYGDGIIFLSSTKNTAKMVPGQISFGMPETYWAVPGDSTPGILNVFSGSNFPYPSDAIAFTSDYNTMYFTKYLQKAGKEKIFRAVNASGNTLKPSWTESGEPLSFCNDEFNYTHPALSDKGDIMIYASDRNGSGGMDLFMSKKEGETWTSPQNLGNDINTKGNELYPCFDSYNNIYFSSDGLPGLGGFDVFTSKFNGKGWEKPVNLSKMINSINDDVSFTISRKDGKSGFMTRRQTGGGNIQLYKLTLNNSYATNNIKNLSDALYNALRIRADLTAEKKVAPAETIKPATGESKKEVKPAEKTAAVVSTEKNVTGTLNSQNKSTAPKTAVAAGAAGAATASQANNQSVVYRIQFASNVKAKGSFKVTINNKSYDTYEYLYNGAYRSTVGELKSLSEAKAFQTAVRQSGYSGAFVVAFKDNIRSLDPALFK